MNIEQAKDVLSHIVEQKLRWGKQYDASDIGLDKVTEALIALAQGDGETTEVRKSLTKANRQLGASNARETKLKKTIEELRHEVTGLNGIVDRISNGVPHSGGSEGSSEDGEGSDT
jgi:hypothetical protein